MLAQLERYINQGAIALHGFIPYAMTTVLHLDTMTFKKEILAKNINERCILMARSEADAACGCPQLGEEIYRVWTETMTETMDASSSDDFDTSELVQELSDKYQVAGVVVNSLFEEIRQLVLRYDELIDRISVEIKLN